MLQLGWSGFVLRFPTLQALLPNLRRLFQVHHLQLVSPLPSCSTAFLVLIFLSLFCFLSFSLMDLLGLQSLLNGRFPYFIFSLFSNRYIWLSDETLTSITTWGLSGPRSNSNEGVTPHSPEMQSFLTSLHGVWSAYSKSCQLGKILL